MFRSLNFTLGSDLIWKGKILKIEKIALDVNREDVKLEIKHLDAVVAELNLGLLSLIEQRKKIIEFLIEYRKMIIEENRFDEDKPLDAPDHEMFAKEEALKSNIKRSNEIEDLINSPYFGKISFIEAGVCDEIYIGKYGYFNEKDYEPVVIDWRAPIASLFYHGGLGKAEYNAPNGKIEADINGRRQFLIKNSKMLGMFDSEVEVRDEILQYVLSSNTQNKLKDIIMTIQKEQDRIIRYDRQGTVLVNGVAGSGKTTIALHRVAYLIYNNRKQLEDKIMILGPNNIFMDYISQVLPTLGEESVKQNNLYDFVREAIGFEGNVLESEDFIEAVMSGDEELKADYVYKRSFEYLKNLDSYVKSLERDLYPIKEIMFNGKVLFTEDEIAKMMKDDFAYMPLMKRGLRVKRVIISRLKYERNELVREINLKYKNLKRDVIDNNMVIDKTRSRREEIRRVIEKVNEVRDEIRYFGKGDISELYTRQNTQRILLKEDLIPMLYLADKIKGVKLPSEIKYLVIDEAQDYSLANLQVIKDVTKCKDYTIVGDINQRIVTDSNPDFTMADKIFENTSIFNLTRSYRSTDEIVRYASKYAENADLINTLREGDDVSVINVNSMDEAADRVIEAYKELRDNDMETIAIITRNFDDAELLNIRLKNKIPYRFIKNEDGLYDESTLLISSYLAKGLEFDAVILVDSKEDKNPDLIKYIMATRALHELVDIKIKKN